MMDLGPWLGVIGTLVVVLMTVAYFFGLDRLWRTPPGRRLVGPWAAVSFGAGMATVVVATNPPFDEWADTSLSGHMTQHVLLLAVAAPLLALGEAVPVLAWALPPRARTRVLRRWRPMRRELGGPRWPQWVAVFLVVQLVTMLGWHLRGPYDAAATHPLLHLAEHASFVVTAALFCWMVLCARRRTSGAAVLAVFIDSLGAIAIGAALILSPSPLYPLYAARQGAGALADQQLAGVIMWAYGGALSLVMGIGVFAVWLRRLDREELAPRTSRSGTAPPVPVEPSLAGSAAAAGSSGSTGSGGSPGSTSSSSSRPSARLSPTAKS